MAPRRAIPSWVVERHGELASTNTTAMEAARAGAPEGLVVVARHQSAGRGRLGRTWTAPAGSSLLMSVLVRPGAGVPIEAAHLLTAALALAASDACRSLAGVDTGLKWPNDLVVERHSVPRKLAGLLAESDIEGGCLAAVVVGLGLNVTWPETLPDELAATAIALNHLGAVAGIDELLAAVLDGFGPRYAGLFDDAGRGAVAQEYRARCVSLGRRVRVELGSSTVEGDAVDLSPRGELVVRTGGGDVVVTAGDVVQLRPIAPPMT